MKYFDQEEKEMIESVEKGGWISQKSRIPKIRKLAKDNLKKSGGIIRASKKGVTTL